MKAKCPIDPDHKRFDTMVTYQQATEVTSDGMIVDVVDGSTPQVLVGPDPGNQWLCLDCFESTEDEVEAIVTP